MFISKEKSFQEDTYSTQMEECIPSSDKKKRKKQTVEEIDANKELIPEPKSKKRKEKGSANTTHLDRLEDSISLSNKKERKKKPSGENVSTDDDPEPKSNKKKKPKKTSTNSENTDHAEASEKRLHFQLKEESAAQNEPDEKAKNFFLQFGVNAFIDTELQEPEIKRKVKESRRTRVKRRQKKKELKLAKKLNLNAKVAKCPEPIKRDHPLSEAPDAIAERRRIKSEKRLQRERDEDLRSQKALRYLETYKNDRSSWKFNKNTNIFLIKNYLDPQRVPDSHFPIVLEYFKDAKGNAMKNIKDLSGKALTMKSDQTRNLKRAHQVVSLFD